MADDPWLCRHCGAGLDMHDHSSWLGKFFCRGTHLQQEFSAQEGAEPIAPPSAERGPQPPALVPCPFCGSLQWHFVSDLVTRAMQVECKNCGARSPRFCDPESKAAALAAWSGRAV